MKVVQLLQFAVRELASLPHPTRPDVVLRLERLEERIKLIDNVLGKGSGRYQALSDDFYDALGQYLYAPRHRKAQLRGSIDRLALCFEGFLRVAVQSLAPERNTTLRDQDGKSYGSLADQGYIDDILRELCGIDAKLRKQGDEYWSTRSTEEATYGEVFRHQQRAKHESRDYTLDRLESLARCVIGSYLIFAGWALEHTDTGRSMRPELLPAEREAMLAWPVILELQLSEMRIGSEDPDLQEEQDRLREIAARLQERAAAIRDAGSSLDEAEIADYRVALSICAEEYEQLVTHINMRDWGREDQYSEYI